MEDPLEYALDLINPPKEHKVGFNNYKCKGPVNGWPEGNYQIDRENHKSRKYAIWHKMQWFVSGISSMKKASVILHKEFASVEIDN